MREPLLPTELDLFEQSVLRVATRKINGMVRGDDPVESQRAAIDTLEHRSALQAAIMLALSKQGPLTDRELENLPEFSGLGPSTVRKRRCELFQRGIIHKTGRRDKMAIWAITPQETP